MTPDQIRERLEQKALNRRSGLLMNGRIYKGTRPVPASTRRRARRSTAGSVRSASRWARSSWTPWLN